MSQKNTKWFSEDLEKVVGEMGTDLTDGLSSTEVKQRLEHYGMNKLTEKETESKWMKFLKQFRSGVIYILIASAVITLLLAQYIDAAVIIVVIFANALIGFFQESKAEEALKSIQNMLSVDATVIRDGKRMDVEAKNIVPGDLIYLESGDSVPADLRIVQSENLRIQESSLTGESESVEKQTEALADDTVLGDRTNMAFSSTNVTKGNGLGIVVEIGDQTQIGQISESMSEVRETKTPLMKQTDKVAKMNSIAVIVLGVFLFAFAYFFRDYEQGELFLAVITMVVGTIPEGLPAIMSMTMAIGVQKMAKENAIVKSLPSVETLGAVNVINTDKTGTLTKNEMTIQDIMTTEHTYKVTGRGYIPEGTIELDGEEVELNEHPDLDKLIRGGQIANDSTLSQEDGKWIINGEPTDACFLTLAKKVDKDKQDFKTIDTIPFDTDFNFVARLVEWEDGKRQIFLKGAPDKLFSLAEKQDANFERDLWQERMNKMTAKGERVIGVAYKEVDSTEESVEIEDVEAGVRFIGLAGIIDPPREAVIDAVEQAKHAGITIKMITGDHPDTAVAIGEQIGLTNGEGAISGQQLDQMSEEEVRKAVAKHNVFARMSPDNKLQIVTALQEIGMTISMTGDGVNDAPALKKADIGVSMGIKGTETAQDASDMVLTDDDFETIVNAVREGRRVYANIKKSIDFLLPTSYGLGLIVFISILLGLTMPMRPVQILWINMVTAITLSFAFVYEPADPDIMNRPPRPKETELVDGYGMFRLVYVALFLAGASVFANYWLVTNGYSTIVASTVTVNSIAIADMFYMFNIRAQNGFAFKKGFFDNKIAFGVSATLILLQLALTYVPFMQTIFNTESLDWQLWGIPFGIGLLLFILVEIEKAISRTRRK